MTLMSRDGKLPVNLYPTLGCCGLDCGLCPRYYTVSSSKCPGCCGSGFFNKRTSCPFITCCTKKKKLESCAQCDEFPCSRFKGGNRSDSFVTKQKSLSNLNMVKEGGLEQFIKQQKQRIKLLKSNKAEIFHLEWNTRPAVYYLDLHKMTKCFIAGAVVFGDTDECTKDVTATLTGKGKQLKTKSNVFGNFEFDGLGVGKYSVKFECEGYVSQAIDVDLRTDTYLGDIILAGVV